MESDHTLWLDPRDSLNIGIRSLRSKGQSEDNIYNFDSISVDSFGLPSPGTNNRRSWVELFSVAALPGKFGVTPDYFPLSLILSMYR
jgi:hypothetical protein